MQNTNGNAFLAVLDREVTADRVDGLSGPDALAEFLAYLGYNTKARMAQTPYEFGITNKELAGKVKRLERLARDDNGLLNVYLIELTSLTVAAQKALATSIKNLAGFFLLVLTKDYERIDFVLLEPARIRTLSAIRRDPGRRELRVLRRLTYTEPDPLSQYLKLISAFDVADWSSEHFNNRALFSDYFLNERLRGEPEWKEDPTKCFRGFLDLYANADKRLVKKTRDDICQQLFEPVFELLGFQHKRESVESARAVNPHYSLSVEGASNHASVACLVYPWGRDLDGKDRTRDAETPDENPGAKVVSVLQSGDAQWAIVTNGKLWRLYYSKAHSRATNYYEIDLEEALALRDPNEAFRYFWLLFRAGAIRPVTTVREGQQYTGCFVESLFDGSLDYAKRLGDKLKDRIFLKVFPHFAKGFISYMRETDVLVSDIDQPMLDQVFQGTLTFLYRLLFLLYAEARSLLPVNERGGYWEISLASIKQDVAEAAGKIQDLVPDRIENKFGTAASSCQLYDRITRLSEVIDRGDPKVNVPVYDGGLFLSDVPDDDDSQEGRNALFLNRYRIPDKYLGLGLDLIARDIDERRKDLVFIDYKSLGVRQLGSIYEGLLEFKLRIASKKMAVVKGKKTEEVIPYQEALQKDRRILTDGRGKDAREKIIEPGDVYLENDKRERKATGSYYTPDYIVRYIVEHAVGPVLEKKFEALKQKLREAQKTLKKQKEWKADGKQIDPENEAYLCHVDIVTELFDVKVLDPAMGSGHFLVQVVDFVTDRMLDFLNAFPWNPVVFALNETRQAILDEMGKEGITINVSRLSDVNLIKRHVLKRCIFGVDLNPMAVELAKVSLWLDCFTLGAPLSFLDHHLKCGNSLIGADIATVQKALKEAQASLFESNRFAGLMLATDLMRQIGELPDVTASQLMFSRERYGHALNALAPFRRELDVYSSRWFGNEPVTTGRGKKRQTKEPVIELLQCENAERWLSNPTEIDFGGKHHSEVARIALATAQQHRFFHWELEFPEVFFGPSQRSDQVIEKKSDGGFDAVIGNPPYVRQEGLGAFKGYFECRYDAFSSIADLYVPFIEKGHRLLSPNGLFGMIISNKWLRAAYGERLREFLANRVSPLEVLDLAGLPVFEKTTVRTLILISARQRNARDVLRYLAPIRLDEFRSVRSGEDLEQMKQQNAIDVDLGGLSRDKWSFCGHDTTVVMKRFQDQCAPLSQYLQNKPFRGVITGLNKAFVIDRNTRDALIAEDPASVEIIKPLLTGRDVRRYHCEFKERYLIVTYIGLPIQKSPALLAHLQRFQPQLQKRCDKGNYWWELRACDYYHRFEQPKIIYPDIAKGCRFALDQDGHLSTNTTYFIPSSDLYLLGILNSRLGHFYFSQVCAGLEGGGATYLRFFAQYVENFPVRPAGPADRARHDRMIELVERMPLLHKRLDEVRTEHDKEVLRRQIAGTDAEIDRLVYELYGLTEEEIAIVEARYR